MGGDALEEESGGGEEGFEVHFCGGCLLVWFFGEERLEGGCWELEW